MGKRNPLAQVLRTVTYRPRRTKVTKGKGSYTRTKRHRSVSSDGVFFYARIAPSKAMRRNELRTSRVSQAGHSPNGTF